MNGHGKHGKETKKGLSVGSVDSVAIHHRLHAATAFLRERVGSRKPHVGIVLGSGLGALAAAVEGSLVVRYADIPGFPDASVAGHRGELIFGRIGETEVMLQAGRFHLYEGHDPQTVVLPVRTFAELGVETLIVTNAAGGIRPSFIPPTLMAIADHINLMWRNPLLGPVGAGESRFPDMSEPYSQSLRALARRQALEIGVSLEEGVYAGVLGPNYETPAEIRMLSRLGADAVGMSTVPEVIAARARGMQVLGISTITNLASGISPSRLDHAEVLAAAAAVTKSLEAVVRGVLGAL